MRATERVRRSARVAVTFGLVAAALVGAACHPGGRTAEQPKAPKAGSPQPFAAIDSPPAGTAGPHPLDGDPEWVALRDGLPSFVVGPIAEAIRDAKTLYVAGDEEAAAAAMETVRGRLAAARLSRADDPARGLLADAMDNLRRVAGRLRDSRPVAPAEIDGALWTAYAADYDHVLKRDERARHLTQAAEELRRAEQAARESNRTTQRAATNRARGILISEVARADPARPSGLARDLDTLTNRVLNPTRIAMIARSVERMSRPHRPVVGRPPRRPRPTVSAAPQWTTRRRAPMLRR